MELNVREAARVLGVPEKKIYRWIDENEIPFYMIGGQPRFSRAALLEWATSRTMPVSVDVFQGQGENGQGPGLVEALRAGGVHTKGLNLQSDLDYVRGMHSFRAGVQLEGGTYRSDDSQNYFGTYTFESLAAYQAGTSDRPA